MNHTVVVALNIFINLNIMCDLGVNHTKMEMLNCSSLANDPIKKNQEDYEFCAVVSGYYLFLCGDVVSFFKKILFIRGKFK